MARMRKKGRTITVLLDPETYQLLQILQKQMGGPEEPATQAQAITAALRALSPTKAKHEATEAEIDAIFAEIEAMAAAARRRRQ